MELLLENTIKLINQNSKTISYTIKNLQKVNIYKSYTNLLDHIKSKYKTKNFSLETIIDHYKKIIPDKEEKFQRKGKRKNTGGNAIYRANLGLNRILKNNDDNNKLFFGKDNIFISKLALPDINIEERRNKSISHSSSTISERLGFNEINSQNDSEENEMNNKRLYSIVQIIKPQIIQRAVFGKTQRRTIVQQHIVKHHSIGGGQHGINLQSVTFLFRCVNSSMSHNGMGISRDTTFTFFFRRIRNDSHRTQLFIDAAFGINYQPARLRQRNIVRINNLHTRVH